MNLQATLIPPADQVVTDPQDNVISRVRRGDVIAVTDDSIEQVLGHLVFYGLPDARINHAELVRVWATHPALDPGLVPREPTPAVVFTAACRSLETKRGGTSGRVEIKVDEALRTPDEVVMQVTFLVRDKGSRLVEHPKAVRFTLNRHLATIRAERLGGTHLGLTNTGGEPVALPDPQELIDRVRSYYSAHNETVGSDVFRAMLRHQVRLASGESVRESGGVYFIPRRHRPVLDALAFVVDDLTDGRGEFHRIPLADDTEQRAMVRRHFVANCVSELDRQIGQITQVLRARTDGAQVQDKTVATLVRDANRLRAVQCEYADLLHDELAELDTRSQLLSGQLRSLMGGEAQA